MNILFSALLNLCWKQVDFSSLFNRLAGFLSVIVFRNKLSVFFLQGFRNFEQKFNMLH
jgi:hypothetical protein